ncbi:MAG: hypothetical protein ACRD1K_07475 [Acidimicrobiales bacterium]
MGARSRTIVRRARSGPSTPSHRAAHPVTSPARSHPDSPTVLPRHAAGATVTPRVAKPWAADRVDVMRTAGPPSGPPGAIA